MLGAGVGIQPQYRGSGVEVLGFPSGFAWDQIRFPMGVKLRGTDFTSTLSPRDLVDPQIWTGTTVHVDSATGDDSNNGLGAYDGDFSAPKRTIYGAFATGNATGGAYRVLVKAGQYEESAFTRNGKNEPNQPVAIVGWGGAVRYRAGPFSVSWSNVGATYSAPVISVKRLFRTDVLTAEGSYSELPKAEDLAMCQAIVDTWFLDGQLYQISLSHLYSKSGQVKVRLLDGDAIFVDLGSDIEAAQKYFQQQLLLIETRQRSRQAALEALQAEVTLLRDRQSDQRENFLKAQSLGAHKPDYVYLTGEVGVQSRFALPFAEQAVLADALFDAGGIAPGTGDVSQIYVLRGPTKDEEFRGITAWHLDAINAIDLVYAADFQLRPKDIIFVAEQPVTRWDRAMSQAIPNFYGATSSVGN